MPIINSVLAGGGAPVSEDTTMSLPIDVETSGNNISMFGGSYTSTLNASTVGQTKGYKNDAYIVLDQDDTESLVLSQTETFPSGSFKSAVMSSTSIYLDDTKTNIVGTESPTGFDVSYEPTVEQLIENFTRVGSPTITDGILGNLTGSNYLEFPGVGIGTADSWEIFTKVKTGSSTSSSYYILGGGDGKVCFDYGIAGNVWKFYLSSNGSSWNLASNINKNIPTSTSTWYYVKFYFTGTKYEMDISTDGETWTNVAEFASTTKVYNCPTMRVGNTNDRSWPWKDYIDLNETYIKVNGMIVWRPIVQPSAGYITVGEGYAYVDENNPPFLLDSDLTKTAGQLVVHSEDFVGETEYDRCFTTVYNPTIDRDHWINCSYKGLFADRQIDNSFSTFEIGLKIDGCSNINPKQILFASKNNNYASVIINIASGHFVVYLSSNGSSSWDIANGTSGTYSVQTDTLYYLKLVFDGSKYVLSYSLDGVTYTNDITVTSSTKVASFIPTTCSQVKTDGSVIDSFSGFIDLDDVYVKTDDNLAWSPYMPKTIKKGTLFLMKPTSSTTSDVVCANSTQPAVVRKYTTTGSSVVVDSNHRASGFTETDYIKVPLNAWMGVYSVETVIHFKTPEVFGSDYYQGLGIDDSHDWRVGVRSDGVFCGSAGSFGTMSYSMQPNTEYWIKLLSPSGDAYMSTDGENYTRIGGGGPRFNNSQVMQNFCLGKMYNDSHAFEGTIYLDDCYIKLDGAIASAPFITESVSVSPTPTGTYAGSVATPLDMEKIVTLDDTLTKIILVEDSA